MDEIYSSKVYKMGNKLGIYLPKKVLEKFRIHKGEFIEINFLIKNNILSYMTKLAGIISLRKEIINNFKLKEGDNVKFKLNKLKINKHKNCLKFKDNKVDLLYLIPNKTITNSEIIIKPFKVNDEDWIRLWSCHERGSTPQIEIRRYIHCSILGRLLGQMQAEGTKSLRSNRLEFSNRSLIEHKDFASYLRIIGINDNLILAKSGYNQKEDDIDDIVNNFEKETNVNVIYNHHNPSSKGRFGFHTFVRSILLYSVIMQALNIIRLELTKKKWDNNMKILGENFLAKLLSGDGDIEIISKNRKTPTARLKITDINQNYLRDYQLIMKQFGFNSNINTKSYFVRSYLNNYLAKRLLEIGAFNGNKNEGKIIDYLNSRTHIK
jgi:hypothetical protein